MNKKKVFFISLVVAIVIAWAFFFFQQIRDFQKMINRPTVENNRKITPIITATTKILVKGREERRVTIKISNSKEAPEDSLKALGFNPYGNHPLTIKEKGL